MCRAPQHEHGIHGDDPQEEREQLRPGAHGPCWPGCSHGGPSMESEHRGMHWKLECSANWLQADHLSTSGPAVLPRHLQRFLAFRTPQILETQAGGIQGAQRTRGGRWRAAAATPRLPREVQGRRQAEGRRKMSRGVGGGATGKQHRVQNFAGRREGRRYLEGRWWMTWVGWGGSGGDLSIITQNRRRI